MKIPSTFALAATALLATTTSGSPLPLQPRSRSFTVSPSLFEIAVLGGSTVRVNQVPNVNFFQGRRGPMALANAYRKFGLAVPQELLDVIEAIIAEILANLARGGPGAGIMGPAPMPPPGGKMPPPPGMMPPGMAPTPPGMAPTPPGMVPPPPGMTPPGMTPPPPGMMPPGMAGPGLNRTAIGPDTPAPAAGAAEGEFGVLWVSFLRGQGCDLRVEPVTD